MNRRASFRRELREDVALHNRGGGGGERQHRGGTQQVQVLAEHAVVGAEVVAPLRDAVGLVDGDERWLALAEHLRETGNTQPLGRDEEKLQAAVEVVNASLARGLAIEPGVDAGDAEAACAELGRLVLHERDQRADDQRRAAAGNGRQLIAERFACAGGHDQQQVAPGDGGAADLLLIRAKGREAEGAGEQIVEAASFRRGRACKESWPGRLGHGG